MVFCFRWIKNPDRGNGPNPRSIFNIALPGPSAAAVYQDYYKGYYKKENSHTCNNVIKIQTPKLR
jgi:hypothetical protein